MDGGNMDKEATISELLKMLANPKPKAERLYNVMDGLGIAYKRTSCIKCLRDYVAICLEELRAIDNAADISGFDNNEEINEKL